MVTLKDTTSIPVGSITIKDMFQKLLIRRIYEMIPSQMENKKKRVGI